MKFNVVKTQCNCHPENCACLPWTITKDGERYERVYSERHAMEIAEALNRQPMKWTTDKPTVPGWYWWTADNGMPPKIFQVCKDDDVVYVLFQDMTWDRIVSSAPWKWSGPIPKPEAE